LEEARCSGEKAESGCEGKVEGESSGDHQSLVSLSLLSLSLLSLSPSLFRRKRIRTSTIQRLSPSPSLAMILSYCSQQMHGERKRKERKKRKEKRE